jgi:hypothetical protein
MSEGGMYRKTSSKLAQSIEWSFVIGNGDSADVEDDAEPSLDDRVEKIVLRTRMCGGVKSSSLIGTTAHFAACCFAQVRTVSSRCRSANSTPGTTTSEGQSSNGRVGGNEVK